jgi:type II secretory pathway component PulJ
MLMELVLAVSVGALVILQAATILWTANRAQKQATSIAEREAQVCSALQLIAADLRQLQPSHATNPPVLYYEPKAGTQQGPVLRLRLSSPLIAGGRQRLVDYLLVADAQAEDPWVRRSEIAVDPAQMLETDATPAADVQWETLLQHVEQVQLRLFDGSNWSADRWDSRVRGLPRLIEITLTLNDGRTMRSFTKLCELVSAASGEVSRD